MTQAEKKHSITIDRYAKSLCGTPGHYDTVIECSCGWNHRISHGGDAHDSITTHRITALERVVGMKFNVAYKS
jgi:hypothetical protein